MFTAINPNSVKFNMRKAIFFLLAITFTTSAVSSQYVFNKESNLGLKVGGTVSMVAFNPSIDLGLNFGFTGGLVFKHIEQKGLGIQLELNFMQAGWKEKLDTTNRYSRQLNYIQIPFMTHVNLGEGRTRLILNLGPYGTILLWEKERISLIEEQEPSDHYGRDLDNWFEFGLCAGIGLAHYTSIGVFQLEARYNQSLSNIFDYSESQFISSKNQVVELSLSYLLDLHARKIGSTRSSE